MTGGAARETRTSPPMADDSTLAAPADAPVNAAIPAPGNAGGASPCADCRARLQMALAIAATCRAPMMGRAIGPFEAAMWRRLQAVSGRRVREALAAKKACDVR